MIFLRSHIPFMGCGVKVLNLIFEKKVLSSCLFGGRNDHRGGRLGGCYGCRTSVVSLTVVTRERNNCQDNINVTLTEPFFEWEMNGLGFCMQFFCKNFIFFHLFVLHLFSFMFILFSFSLLVLIFYVFFF